MNIEEIKRNRFKKFMLVVLFAILIILGLNNSTYAVTVTSISGRTWNVTSDADKKIAELYNEVQGLTADNIMSQNLPTNIYNKIRYRTWRG